MVTANSPPPYPCMCRHTQKPACMANYLSQQKLLHIFNITVTVLCNVWPCRQQVGTGRNPSSTVQGIPSQKTVPFYVINHKHLKSQLGFFIYPDGLCNKMQVISVLKENLTTVL